MLLRLAERLNMPVALPETGNYFGHPRHFRAGMVHRPLGAHNTTYRLLAHHMRLDRQQVTQVSDGRTVQQDGGVDPDCPYFV